MAFNFAQKIKQFEAEKRNLPTVLGNMAKNHFLKSFRDGGFTDSGFEPWQARKRRDKNPKPRAILVKSGHLRKSIRVRVATYQKIEIGAYNIPYAVFHNTGVGKMPKRKFIGSSVVLTRKIKTRIFKEIKNILR